MTEAADLANDSREKLLELYRQHSTNARTLIDLRVKHFATFSIITGLLANVTLNSELTKAYRPYLFVFSLSMTVLFFLLDYRTSILWSNEKAISDACETKIGKGLGIPAPTLIRTSLRATFITRAIFMIIFLFWSAGLLAELLA